MWEPDPQIIVICWSKIFWTSHKPKDSFKAGNKVSKKIQLINTLWSDQLCSEWYSDGVLWLSVYRNWDSRTVGTVTVCCDCRCTGTETAELSVQWRCAVTVGVQELRQQNCWSGSWQSYLPIFYTFFYSMNIVDGDPFKHKLKWSIYFRNTK